MAEVAQDNRISVRVNGETRAVALGSTIAEMLRVIGINPLKVAVERNLEIMPRSTFEDEQVRDGDSFEIVHFVGGG
jgi:thiazole synthase